MRLNRGRLHLYDASSGTHRFVATDDITHCEAAKGLTTVHLEDGIWSARLRLSEIERLAPGVFLRLQRASLVNVARIRAVHVTPKWSVEIDNGRRLPVAPSGEQRLIELISAAEGCDRALFEEDAGLRM